MHDASCNLLHLVCSLEYIHRIKDYYNLPCREEGSIQFDAVSGVGQRAAGAERSSVQGGGDAGGREVRQPREQEALPGELSIHLVHY